MARTKSKKHSAASGGGGEALLKALAAQDSFAKWMQSDFVDASDKEMEHWADYVSQSKHNEKFQELVRALLEASNNSSDLSIFSFLHRWLGSPSTAKACVCFIPDLLCLYWSLLPTLDSSSSPPDANPAAIALCAAANCVCPLKPPVFYSHITPASSDRILSLAIHNLTLHATPNLTLHPLVASLTPSIYLGPLTTTSLVKLILVVGPRDSKIVEGLKRVAQWSGSQQYAAVVALEKIL